ncbi:MAG: family 20 glycosylhydrolase [Clostridia bacterium]|nr:family 20 glycosylhydrolase [Clostridia bacterium]
MKLINLPEEYKPALEILGKRLGTDAIDLGVEYSPSEEIIVSFDGKIGAIKCSKKHHFARALGLFVQNYKKNGGKPFKKTEKADFETLSCMLCVSSYARHTLDSLKEFAEYMALFGFNQMLMYMEDMYEIPGRPFFGYMRGRYTYAELKELDDYAYDLGIEVVACMQTLGHLFHYLQWPEANGIKENAMVLEPENENTYKFVEEMIINSSAPFRSKRIHIGCDETHGLGMGSYFKKHGYKEPLELFVGHVNRVAEICKKHGLKPMMWSDMFIAFSSKTYNNYDKEAVISDEIKALVNPEIDLVFWHYGQFLDCDAPLIDKHVELNGRAPIFAGGVRIWQSALCDNIFSEKATRVSLPVCKEKGVKEVVITVWCYNRTIYQTCLLELARYGEFCYNDDDLGTRDYFEFITGASYDAFMMMSNFNYLYETDEQKAAASYWNDTQGRRFYECDIMQNVVEKNMQECAYSGYHRRNADWFRPLCETESEWTYLYRFCRALFEHMAVKFEIVENLTPAYKRGDREMLKKIADELLPEYIKWNDESCELHMYHKDKYLYPYAAGTESSYGAKRQRALGAIRRIKKYLSGELSTLVELDEEKLMHPGNGPEVFV